MEIRNASIVIGYDEDEGSVPEVLGIFDNPDEAHQCKLEHEGQFDHIMVLFWID